MRMILSVLIALLLLRSSDGVRIVQVARDAWNYANEELQHCADRLARH